MKQHFDHHALVSSHPFDRYAPFTNIAALKDFSDRPLRKSIRVNTLKTSVDQVKSWAAERGWQLEQVPWCPEGFFVERENREKALGKDLLHLLGHIYLQEAASMLPVMLLDPQPGETILDMSAAPGSKTTQISARMNGRGIIVANDVQEKRLWTLKAALHRSGVSNVIVTRKVGQWFAKQMTERFDRVLCDAPCTAQGTSRKDSDALEFSSDDNVGKMARLQRELLESAVHAAKVGGTIVYSTCTLTPEENEQVVGAILSKFPTQLSPLPLGLAQLNALKNGMEDSLKVQRTIGTPDMTAIRLWPHVFNTEGFFAAAFVKTAPTRDRTPMEAVRFQEERVPRARQKDIGSIIEEMYGTSMLHEGDRLFQRGDQLILSTEEVADYPLPVQNYSLGMPMGRRLDNDRIRVDHEFIALRGMEATKSVTTLNEEQLGHLLDGKDTTCALELRGDIVLRYKHFVLGFGLAKDGHLKNRLPRWIVQKS